MFYKTLFYYKRFINVKFNLMFYKTSKVTASRVNSDPQRANWPLSRSPARWRFSCQRGHAGGPVTASLEHAYHHLNFAWNGRFKTMLEADAQFGRNERFPRPHGAVGWFAKFWPKMARTSQ